MKLFKNEKINFFVYTRIYIFLNKIRTKQTRPHAFFKIFAYMHWNSHWLLIIQKNYVCNYTGTKNQSIGSTCIYL